MGQKYVWQRSGWPTFTWDSEVLLQLLGQARRAQGKMMAHAHEIGLDERADLMVEEAFATSAIEGENLDRRAIRSSVAKRLGLPTAGLPPQVRQIDGLVDMLVDATTNYHEPLNAQRLHGWHAGIFPTGYSSIHKIAVGKWRAGKGPMRVISVERGREMIHFEAPPSACVAKEMGIFLTWWQHHSQHLDGLIRAGIAHFWFVTIHPYDDGNGRISRAITDMALSQDEQSGRRLYNLSTQIVKDRNAYYAILESCQKQTSNITAWLVWFLGMYIRAIEVSEGVVQKTLLISKFWQIYGKVELNQRQIKVVQKLLDAEPQGFEGGINNRKYVSLTSTSRETAKRDLLDLEKKGILKRNTSQGRSIGYFLKKMQ